MLDVLQLRSAVGASEGYRRILVRPDISGSAFKKDFHVREVKVYVNDAPQAPPAGLDDHTVKEDVASDHATATYVVPAFTDDEDTELEYEAKLVVGGVEQDLPTDAWIEFDKDTRTFTFKPLASHVGSHTLRVRGTDSGGLWVEDDFEVVVSAGNDAPKASSLADQNDVVEDAPSSYVFSKFTDKENDAASVSLTYTFSVVRVAPNDDETAVSVSEIEQWIDFDDDPLDDLGNLNPTFRTFTFTPTLSSHAGKYKVRVRGTDSGGEWAEDAFEVVVVAVNDAPEASAVPDQTVDEDATVTYQVLPFKDEETSTLTYTFEVVQDDRLTPVSVSDWVKFDDDPLSPTFRTFEFKPLAAHVGDYTLRVTGTDDEGLSASVEFKVTVAEVNDAPKAPTAALARQEVDEDVASDHATATYRVPAFTDEETSTLTYTFSVVRVERVGDADRLTTLSGLEIGWIDFDDKPLDDQGNLNPTFRTFTFTPTLSSHAGRYKVTVVATDAGIGNDVATRERTEESVSAEFYLEVAEVNDAPEPPEAPKQALQAVEDLKLTYQVPAFTDEETSTLTLTYTFSAYRLERVGDADRWTLVSVSDWVKFDDDPSDDKPLDPLITAFREFTFEPTESSHAGDYRLRVTATDAGIGDDAATKRSTEKSAYVEFMLKVIAVNDLPEGEALPNQSVTEDTPETYSFPKFTDEETSASALEHTASWVRKDSDGNDMKDADGEKVFVDLTDDDWIEFEEDPDDDTKMKFTFSPDKSWHAGVYTLRVTADDGQGGETSKVFLLQVSRDNDKPVASSLANQDDVVEDTSSTYEFDAFTDEEDDAAGVSLKYTFSVVRVVGNVKTDVSPLWITLVSTTRTFTFTPSDSSHAGTYKVTVVGTDAGGKEASAEFTLTVGAFNDKPKASSLANQDDVVEDTPSIYRFDAFTDEEDDAAGVSLTYTFSVVRVVSGVKTPISTPDWIDFDDDPLDDDPLDDDPLNPTFLTFTFTPKKSLDAGSYEVTVVGADAGGKEASAVFTLTVGEFNDAPVASALKDHLLTDAVVEDTEITYKFDAFEDEETSPLTYSYTVVRVGDGGIETAVSVSEIQQWVEFDATTRTFTFTPSKSWHGGSYKVTVKGEDAGIPGNPTPKSVSEEFELEVKAVNDPPVAPVEFAQEVSKRVEEGGVLTYQVPVFKDEEDDAAKQSIEYEAKLVVVDQNGDESLLDIPYDDWIAFDEATRTFRFTPSESRHKGVHTVRVFARDTSDVETFVEFKLTVGEFNDAPVASALVAQKVVEDTPSTYAFNAFTDEETSTLTYSHTVERVVSGVKTAVSPKWIEFDEATLTFKFTPSDSSHAGKYEVTVKGEDAGIGGDDSTRKSVSEKFVLTVDEFNDAPVASALKDHLLTDAVVEDTETTYKFDAFTDEETSPLAYSYTVVRIEDDDSKTDVSPLWIDFDDDPHDDQGNLNPTFRTFTFKPDKSWHAGTYEVTVRGEDAGIPGKPKKSISAEFELEVKAVNDRPVVPEEFSEEVLQGEEVRRGVEEGTDVPYRVPAFTDEENDRAGAPLAYSYTVVRLATNGDETAVSVSEIEQWIDFDDDPVSADFRTFMFTPSESRHKGVYRVRVFAQDTSGAKTFCAVQAHGW